MSGLLTPSFQTLLVENSLLGKICCYCYCFESSQFFLVLHSSFPMPPKEMQVWYSWQDRGKGGPMGRRVSKRPGKLGDPEPKLPVGRAQEQACLGVLTILSHWLGVACGECGLLADVAVDMEAGPVAEAVQALNGVVSLLPHRLHLHLWLYPPVTTVSLPLLGGAEDRLGLEMSTKLCALSEPGRWECAQGFALSSVSCWRKDGPCTSGTYGTLLPVKEEQGIVC